MFVGERSGNVSVCSSLCVKKRVRRERERPNCSPPTSDTVSCVTEESFYLFSHFISQLFESHMLQPNILCLLLFSTATNITYSILSNL